MNEETSRPTTAPSPSRESLLRMVIDQVPVWLALTDIEGRYLIANKRYQETFGPPGEIIEGRLYHEVFPDLVPRHGPMIEACRTGETVAFLDVLEFERGCPTYVQGVYRPIMESDGSVRYLTLVALDVTDRVSAERAQQRSEENLAVTLLNVADGVLTLDRDDRILRLNAAATELSGWPANEAEGQPFARVFPLIPRERPDGTVRAAGLRGFDVLISRTGRFVPVECRRSPTRDSSGNPIGSVIFLHDATEQVQQETARLRTHQLESLALLAGGIAHDFNNLLAGIMGHLSLVGESTSLEDDTRRSVHAALEAAERARGLTSQLLTFARGGEPVRTVVDLAPAIRQAANLMVSGSSVACAFDLPEDLWPVEADASQVTQVIQNLVMNAVEAMPEGGVVRVSASNLRLDSKDPTGLREGPHVVLEVKDLGVGIPESIRDRIFDPYVSTKGRRSGLGLAISHSIVHRHGGLIRLLAPVGRGSVFQVILPARPDLPIAPVVRPAPLGKRERRILVMDDDPMIRAFLEQALTQMGNRVSLAEEGREALSLHAQARQECDPYEVVIMDLTVPAGMGGLEATAAMRRVDSDAWVIVSSGYCVDPAMARPKDYGFDAVLAKPYTLAQLRGLLAEVPHQRATPGTETRPRPMAPWVGR